MQMDSIYLLKNKLGLKAKSNSMPYTGNTLKKKLFRKAKSKKGKK